MSNYDINSNPKLVQIFKRQYQEAEESKRNNPKSVLLDFKQELLELGFEFEVLNQAEALMPKYKELLLPVVLKYYQRAILRDEKLDLLHWLYHKGFDDAVPLLLTDFYDSNSVTDKWAIADTIYVIQSKSYIEEYIKIITDTELGISRQMIVLLVGKLKVEKAIPILEELLDDETVRLHALTALGYYKQERLCKHFEKYKESKNAALRKCAKNSLEMLTKKNQ